MNTTSAQDQLAKQLLAASHGDLGAATQSLQQAARDYIRKPVLIPNTEVIVAADKVSKFYKVGKNKVTALKSVSLEIHKGEFIAITGTSGSGKSTLLQLLGGLDKPTSGTITINNQNLAKLNDGKLSRFRNKTIGFVFQFFYLQPFLSLQTNIAVPGMFSRTPRKIRTARSLHLAEQVGLGDRVKHLPRELSGGQMQRAAIARALQNNPNILLADEPTGNLDRTNALAIFELFKEIKNKNGTTVIVVTHDVELAENADRIISMSDGAIV